jgi:hypothetical protein
MGISDSKGPRRIESVEASIEHMARVLGSSKGPYRNVTTLSSIGGIYAPVGASNDSKNLNQHWTQGVGRYLIAQGVKNPKSATLILR